MCQITVKQQVLMQCFEMLTCIDAGQLFRRMHPASQCLIAGKHPGPAAQKQILHDTSSIDFCNIKVNYMLKFKTLKHQTCAQPPALSAVLLLPGGGGGGAVLFNSVLLPGELSLADMRTETT